MKCLPEKYNELMSLLYVKEIRLYLPIQELNILLEPIKTRSDLLNEEFEQARLSLIDLNATSSEDEDNEEEEDEEEKENNESEKSSDDESVNLIDYDSSSSVEKLEFD